MSHYSYGVVGNDPGGSPPHVFISERTQKQVQKEIDNLLGLLGQSSSTSEERINDRLEKLERHTLRLSDVKDYLVHLKYVRAIDHEEEVQEFLDILDKCSSNVFEVLHTRHAAAQAIVPPNQAPAAARPTPKAPTAELKPEKLAHDATCLLYTSPSPRDRQKSRMPSSA